MRTITIQTYYDPKPNSVGSSKINWIKAVREFTEKLSGRATGLKITVDFMEAAFKAIRRGCDCRQVD